MLVSQVVERDRDTQGERVREREGEQEYAYAYALNLQSKVEEAKRDPVLSFAKCVE